MKIIDSWVIGAGWKLVHADAAGTNVGSVTADGILPDGSSALLDKPVALGSGTTNVVITVVRKVASKPATFHLTVTFAKGAKRSVALDGDVTLPAGDQQAYYDVSVP